MPNENRSGTFIHIAVFFFCGNYYPRLCVSNFNRHNDRLHHMVVHSWAKTRPDETFKETIARIKTSLLKKAAEKNENVDRIRAAVEEIEQTLN